MEVYTTCYGNKKEGTGWENKTTEIKITIHFRSPRTLSYAFKNHVQLSHLTCEECLFKQPLYERHF